MMHHLAQNIVRLSLILLGCVAVLVGVLVFAVGPDRAASAGAMVFSWLGLADAYSGDLVSANIDSEMRFLAVFWAAYGVWVLRLGLRAHAPRHLVLLALGLFFAGGIGRLLSYIQIGAWPDQMFIVLGIIELAIPIALGALLLLTAREKEI